MPKQSPIADDLDRPFWEAANNDRLVVQNCSSCNRLQHPPQPTCQECGSAANLGWREMSGRGTIYSYGVVYDTPVAVMQPDQPYNLAVIQLEEAPEINMYSHLPGSPVDDVTIGSKVEVVFEVTAGNGQKVPEWRVIG